MIGYKKIYYYIVKHPRNVHPLNPPLPLFPCIDLSNN